MVSSPSPVHGHVLSRRSGEGFSKPLASTLDDRLAYDEPRIAGGSLDRYSPSLARLMNPVPLYDWLTRAGDG